MISDDFQEMSLASTDDEEFETELTETTFGSSMGSKSIQDYEEILEGSYNNKLLDSDYAVKLGLSPRPKPSNTVVVGHLDCIIDYENLFWLLPVAIDENKLPFEASKRAKFNRVGLPGTILSLRCSGKHRGLFKKKQKERKRDMKHCVEIDMSIKSKNVNIRLYASKIHSVGISNHDMIKETVFLINQHIKEIKESQIFLRENPEVIEEFILSCKGEKTIRPGRKSYYYKLIKPELKHKALNIYTAPFNLHEPVDNWKEYVKYIRYINKLSDICSGNVTLTSIHDVVANYCYNLGFTINRSALSRLARGKYDFCSEYDKSKKKEVILSLPIDEEKLIDRPFKESDREPCHIFTIKKKGNVTQKGPSQILCCEAYDLFSKLIFKLRPQIEKH